MFTLTENYSLENLIKETEKHITNLKNLGLDTTEFEKGMLFTCIEVKKTLEKINKK